MLTAEQTAVGLAKTDEIIRTLCAALEPYAEAENTDGAAVALAMVKVTAIALTAFIGFRGPHDIAQTVELFAKQLEDATLDLWLKCEAGEAAIVH